MTQRHDARAVTPRVLAVLFGDAVETFVRREDAERFIEEVRGDDPEMASYLRIEEREREAGGVN
jgi:hypothetical protein